MLLAKEGSFHHQTVLKFKEESSKMLHFWHSSVRCWALWKVDWKHLKSSEMCCWTKIEKISWTDHVRNEEMNTIKRRKANWIGHILHGNCPTQHVIEGKTGKKKDG